MKANEHKVSIVIADDDADEHFMIQEAIKEIGLQLEYTAVYNGTQLIDLLLKQGAYKSNDLSIPDAVILDLNMPVMDGLEALKKIKKHEALKNIPIYILYTPRDDNYTTQCDGLGVSGIYAKPSHFSNLKGIIEMIYDSCCGSRKMLEPG